MKINLISRDNGVGLTRDCQILAMLLSELGHESFFRDYSNVTVSTDPVDANIFVELVIPAYMRHSRCNILIPNPEWYDLRWRQFIPRFQTILCKTRSAIGSFYPMNRRCQYISFTGCDRYRPQYSKDYTKCLHVAGKSGQKGTDMVWEAWQHNPDLPHLTIIQDPGKFQEREHLPNLTYRYERLEEGELLQLQNECGIHVCPSETEGFGHYIIEGLSVKAVVLTTDAPPMNELVTNERGILIPYESKVRQRFATNHFVKSPCLADAVRAAARLSKPEAELLGENARAFYLENDAKFRLAFKDAINGLQYARPSSDPVLETRRFPSGDSGAHTSRQRVGR